MYFGEVIDQVNLVSAFVNIGLFQACLMLVKKCSLYFFLWKPWLLLLEDIKLFSVKYLHRH